MSALIKYDQARQALAACRNVDEIKDIRDKSEAMRLYAKQAQDTELEQWAAEIKFRAQRAIGELSSALETQKGGFGIVPTGGKHKAEVLADAGISTSTANRYKKLAAIPEPVIEEIIAKSKEIGKPVSAKAVMAQVAPKAAPPSARSAPAPAAAPDAPHAPSLVQQVLEQQVGAAPAPDAADEHSADDDPFDQLLGDFHALQREHDKSVARVNELEALLGQNDLASQVDALALKCAQFDSLATSRFNDIADREATIDNQRRFLDDLRKAAGLPKGGDLLAWVKAAARRAA